MFKRFLAVQYKLGNITAEQVQALVNSGTISQSEADEVLGI